jgi:ABC-type transport system involved in multi-copper enzyme maturation permease subunit
VKVLPTFIPMFRAEFFRLTRTRGGRFGLIAPALVGAARIFGGRLLDLLENTRRAAQGLKAAAPRDVTAFGPLADGLSAGAPVLAMTALLVGAFALARERENGGLAQLFLAAPRGPVVAGKLVAIAAWVVLAFALLFGAAMAAAACGGSFSAHVEDGFESMTRAELWQETLRAVSCGLPALLCCAAFGVMMSAMSAGVGAAAVATLVPFTLLALFHATLGAVGPKLFTTYVPFLSEQSPLMRLTKIARAFNDAAWEPGELARAAIVPGAEAVACLVLAWIVTRRRSG